jgi:sulfur-oxidizing protein SoxY
MKAVCVLLFLMGNMLLPQHLHAQAAIDSIANGTNEFDGDPYKSYAWRELKKEYVANANVVFDDRIKVTGPKFAEDSMNVPVSVSVQALEQTGLQVEQIIVLVDRNPIRKVIEYFPQVPLSGVAFRFKLEQSSPVRALVKTKDGQWRAGSTWVEATGGGCTVAGATRKDGTWSQTLGQVAGKVFDGSSLATTTLAAQSLVPGTTQASSRLRFRIMHPMDTGLVGGIPAFYLNKLQVTDDAGHTMLRMNLFEPVSENPVLSFDFKDRRVSSMVLTGTDNNGNRVQSRIE